ncbi:MAG: YDG domain-containing protein, partial [Methylococcaceae bacterium]
MKRHASMNRLYRIIWSEAQQAFIVVSELAKGHCKARSNSRPELADHDARLQQSPPHWPGRILGRNIAHILGISLLGVSMAYAEPGVNEVPTGGQITQGSGSISQNGNTLTVQQNSDKMIGQWNTFNIGEKATVNVHQPSANSIALNRINDSKPSEIYGKLNANGQVYLQNSNGVIFGKTAQVDVGGLVASTQQLSDEDFRNGKTQFKANGNSQNTGRIENHGHITAHGGVVAFIAPQVSNSGSIQNNGGTVAMAAGEQVTLDFEGDGLVKVKVDKAAINALAENKGLIQADGGTVIMTAQSANALMDTVVNNDGIIQAHTLENHGGRIVLDGGDEGVTRVAGTVDADASSGAKDLPTTAAASLPSPANETKVEAVGGTVIATGNKVLVDEGAHLSASGKTGGGKVLVGGSWQNSDPSVRQASATIVAKTAKLEANATDSGNGGTVVAWSDVSKTGSVTRAYGTFEAKGGPNGGDGGRIETSGHWLDTAASLGSAAAPNGKPGEWLFDPYNVTITGANANGSFNGASPDVWTPSASGSTVLNTDIQTRLSGGTNVTITTTGAGAEAGDITVSAPIVMSNTLSLLADGAVTISANISGSGQLILQSGASGAINQPVTLNNSILLGGGQLKITSTGGAQSNAEIDAYGLLELYGSGNFNINSTSGTSDFDNLTANITGSGSIDLYENNDFFNITANGVTCPGNVTLRSKNNFTVTGPIDITDTGNLTLKVATGSFINSNGPITINSGSMSFVTESGSSTYTIGNSITASGAGLSFDQPVTLSGSPAISANGTLAFNAALTVAAASNTVLTANDFTFTGNVTGNGTQQLTLKPYAVGANISLGTAGTLDTALAQISGFSALTLGRADGTGAITLAGGTPLVFSNPTTFLAGGVGGTITVDQAISTAGTAGLSMQAGSALAVNQDITTVNGAISLQGSNVTIANTKTVSTTGTGNIAITGTGTTGTGTGVSINGGTVQTTGSGNITITGTGSGSGAGNTGIFVNSGTVQTTGGGNITLTGYGSTAGTLANNEGITIADGLVEIQSGLARTLTLNGTGGIGTNYNVGVNVRTGSSTVRMSAGVTGQMNVTGIGGSCSGTGCWGVLAENSGVYESLGAASINLTGTGGTGADNMGINYTFGNGRIGSGTMSGDITLTADTMNLTGTGGSLTVRSTGALTVKPLTAATTIGIAGGAGTLALTAANFATNLVNGFSGITVGNSTAGAITVGGALTLYDNTTLESNGAIALNNALSGENITLTSNAGVSSNSSGNVSAIDFVVNAAGAINLSGVNSITGTTSLTAGAANNISLTNIANDFLGAVSVASGNDIAIKDDNDITLGNVAVSGNLTVEALSGDLTVTGSISKSSGSNATATLKASNNIIFNFATVSVISTPNQLNTILWSDSDGDSSGGITIDGDSSIGTTGSIWMGGGSTSSAVETGFSGITVPTGYAWGTADTNGAGILIPGGGADGSTLIQAGSGRNIVMKGHGDAVGSRLSNGAELNTRSKGIDFNRDGPSSQSGFGVSMATSGTGFIILDGIGGATTGNFNYGVNIHSGLITSVSGEIIITGQGGGSGGASDNNHGVYLEDDDNLIQSTLGSIALDGIAGPGASTQGILVGGTNDLIDAGFALTLTNASGSGLTLNGTANGDSTLDITTDSVVFGGSSSLTGTASLLIEPATASTSIGIAGGTGTLQLSAANFLTKFNGFSDITVGNSTTGVITIGGATTFTSNIALISGNDIAINGTLNATGLVDIATDSGNLTVSQNITTTDTSVSAVVLNSGEATAAGITTGGNIIVSGSPTITTGAGGRATFYTGNVSGSTGLTALIGSGSGNFRYNSDESTSNYSAALGAGNYAVYREQAMLTVIPGSATSVYGDAVSIAGVSTTVTGFVNGDDTTTAGVTGTANFNTTVSNGSHVGTYNIAYISGLGNTVGYGITDATGIGEYSVTARTLTPTLSNTGVSKVYDGTTAGNLTPSFSFAGLTSGDSGATLSNTGMTYNSAHVANATQITVSGLAISSITGSGLVSDYVLDATSKNVAAVITAATLTPTLSNTNVTKSYDGTTSSNLTPSFSFAGLVIGDTDAILSNTGIAYNSAHVANAGKITVSGLTIGSITGVNGSVASDYVLDATAKDVAATITAAILIPTLSNTNVTKIYDGSTGSNLTPTFTYTGLVAGDTDATLSHTGIAYDSAHVANATQVTVSGLAIDRIAGTTGSAASDYVLDADSKAVAAAITAATLTPTLSNTQVTKSYDGTPNSSLVPTFSYTGLVTGDTDAILSNTGIAYDSAHVANAGKVTVSGLTIGSITGVNGSVASDYVLDAVTKDVAATITTAILSPMLSNTNVTKTYDGVTSSNLTPTFNFTGLVAGDADATLSYTGIAYDNAHVVNAGKVTVSGLAISSIAGANSSAASDYVLDAASKDVTATITAAILIPTLSNTNITKTYDGSIGSNLTPTFSYTGLVAGDTDATLSHAGIAYDSAHVANASKVTVSGLAISRIAGANGSAVSDYVLDALSKDVAATITAATLTPTLSNTQVSKTYDGTTAGNLTPTFNFTGLVAGDTDATLSNTGIAYNSAHVADAAQVTVSGLAIGSIAGANGSLASDYVLDADTKAVAAAITAATLTPTLSNTQVSKIYDGTTFSDLTPAFSFTGLVAGDTDANLSYTGIAYDSAHVADAAQVTVSGLAISTIAGTNSSAASDYVLDAVTKNVAASITAATLTPTLSNTNVTKTYDGTTDSKLTPTFSFTGLIAGDTDATLSNTGIAYDSAHVATAGKVTVSGLAIGSIAGSNSSAVSDYVLDAAGKDVAASITAATLTPTLSNTKVSKTYDGTTNSNLTPTFTFVGLVAGDTDATLSNTGIAYDSAHVAEASQVTVSGLAISTIAGTNGSAASDYVLDAVSKNVPANIIAATLTSTLSNINVSKTYDGTPFSDLTPAFSFTGLVAGDTDATLSNTGLTYDSAHVADASQVTVAGLAISGIIGANGSLASDYLLDADTQAVAASITAATLTPTLSNTNVTKIYDGSTNSNLTPTFNFIGLIAGDTDATLSNTGIAYDSAHVADATQVSVSGLAISSIAGSNSSLTSDYVLDADTKAVAASITAATLTPTLSNTNVTKT